MFWFGHDNNNNDDVVFVVVVVVVWMIMMMSSSASTTTLTTVVVRPYGNTETSRQIDLNFPSIDYEENYMMMMSAENTPPSTPGCKRKGVCLERQQQYQRLFYY